MGAEKTSPLPGLDLRTVEPLASRYSDWSIAIHINLVQGIEVYTPVEHKK